MSLTITQNFNAYSNNVAIEVTNATYFAIFNRGTTTELELSNPDPGFEAAEKVYYIPKQMGASLPYTGTPYKVLRVSAGINYSIMTDGVITVL